jgi:intracellular multiplication protein IcmB
MRFLDRFFAPFARFAKQPLESFIQLETADDAHTLVAEDGSLVSFISVDGSRQIIGAQEYQRIIEQGTIKLGSRFDRPGYALQVVFTRNPDRIGRELRTKMMANKRAAETIGIDLEDLIDERAHNLRHYLAWEECYFVLWTRPSALIKQEMKRETDKRRAKMKNWVHSPNAQYPTTALDGLRTRHKAYIANMLSAIDELGVQSVLMNCHDALKVVRTAMFPAMTSDGWRAILPGDKIPARAPKAPNDYSDLLWPSLRHQLCSYDAEVISPNIVQIGNKLWSAVDMVVPPADPTPFPQLMARFVEADIPFRISFLIEGGGGQAQTFKEMFARLLAFSNATNTQIRESLESLRELSRDEPVVKLRISAATWGPEGRKDIIEDRASILTQALESWGYAQVSQVSGDPLDEVMSSVPGIACGSTAPEAIAPLSEVLKMLPWQRPSSPFKKGSIFFRSPDGKLWPYQTGTNLTTTWFDLIFAQPGAGKSVLLNTLNLGSCMSPGISSLPFIAIIDIGPSSSGLISLIRESLPPERAHEAAHYRLQMTTEYAINPFDTQLGCRRPLPDERSYLIELMTMISTPPGQGKPYDGIPQLVGFVVDEMYRWRDEVTSNGEARPYLPRVDEDVDQALLDYNIYLPVEATWWDVVDALFERDLIHIATLAQRHAVPTLADAITAARRPQIRSLMEETQIGGSSENVIHAFERMISSAIRELPILAGITKFDIGDTRICALDLMDVSPQGDETADRQTAIMYMLARHVLVRNWWVNEDAVKYMPEKYQLYHTKRLQNIKESPKRLCYDEFHRTSKSAQVRSQVIRDVREGRKWGVQIVLSSQLLKDFDDDMVDLATGVWILGSAVSDSAVQDARERFSLSDTAVWIMRNRLTGPRAGIGAPALFVLASNEGRYEQHLINTLGPIELWALSTSSEDVALRKRMYMRLGAGRARQVLAANFPGGSARNEIKRRVDAYNERGDTRRGTVPAVVDEIAEEMIRVYTETVMERIGKVEPFEMAREEPDIEERENRTEVVTI